MKYSSIFQHINIVSFHIEQEELLISTERFSSESSIEKYNT